MNKIIEIECNSGHVFELKAAEFMGRDDGFTHADMYNCPECHTTVTVESIINRLDKLIESLPRYETWALKELRLELLANPSLKEPAKEQNDSR